MDSQTFFHEGQEYDGLFFYFLPHSFQRWRDNSDHFPVWCFANVDVPALHRILPRRKAITGWRIATKSLLDEHPIHFQVGCEDLAVAFANLLYQFLASTGKPCDIETNGFDFESLSKLCLEVFLSFEGATTRSSRKNI